MAWATGRVPKNLPSGAVPTVGSSCSKPETWALKCQKEVIAELLDYLSKELRHLDDEKSAYILTDACMAVYTLVKGGKAEPAYRCSTTIATASPHGASSSWRSPCWLTTTTRIRSAASLGSLLPLRRL